MSHKLLVSLGLSLVMASGCTALSEDPSEGGLFSYSPQKYEERAADREARLAAIEEQQKLEASQSKELELTKQQKSAKLGAQQKRLNSLNSQVNTLKKELDGAKLADSSKQAELDQLKARLQKVQGEMNTATKSDNIEAREQHLAKLRRDYESLQKDMDALLLY